MLQYNYLKVPPQGGIQNKEKAMKKFLALLLAFVMVAAMAVTVFADPVVDSEQEEGETYEYTSTRVQGFSSFRRSEWKDAGKYNDYEAQYVVECTAPTNGNDGNRGRYCDADTYVIWKFEAKDAETAKFSSTTRTKPLSPFPKTVRTGPSSSRPAARESATPRVTLI